MHPSQALHCACFCCMHCHVCAVLGACIAAAGAAADACAFAALVARSAHSTAQGGAVIYACRVPERWYPGRFDLAGHSHQLWHAAVVLAAWVHYVAIMVLLQWRDASGGCAAGGTGVHAPVHELLGQMQQAGQVPLAIEQLPAVVQRFVARRGL
eukprot:GHRQ01018383.1.p3 GENE.GHRQ01018383.1~~GHRQ01018383.1.p3  ORF type:complete len:154 (+),score=37.69 GHRQ01018383.1:321-782(+)